MVQQGVVSYGIKVKIFTPVNTSGISYNEELNALLQLALVNLLLGYKPVPFLGLSRTTQRFGLYLFILFNAVFDPFFLNVRNMCNP